MSASPNNLASVQQALRDIGWPIGVDGRMGGQTHAAISDFQHGWANSNLLVDGWAGPMTCDAMNACLYFGGHCSSHFLYRDFKSKGNGWIKVNRTLVRGLEKYRAFCSPGGVRVVSGYRDPAYNAATDGSASNSQHMYGAACDLDEVASFGAVKALGVFSGIGVQRSNGRVRHVDVRGQDGAPATTAGTPGAPSLWYY